LEQLEQLAGRRAGGQGDFADAVEVETLHEHRQTLPSHGNAVQLDADPAGADPQRDGRVLEEADQGAELLLLLALSSRIAEQAHTACEPSGERIEGRHGGRRI